MSEALKYRQEIDGLRAIAVIPVIFFHAGISGFSGGYIGVDVFFVISGFLITQLLIVEIKSEEFSFQRFYERRARRLLPALFLVLLFSIICSWLLLTPESLVSFSKSLLSVLAFSSNFFFWSESGYFDTASELKPLLHTWSLAVEEQFYLVFPFFCLFLAKITYVRGFFVLCAIVVLSLIASEILVRLIPSAAFFLAPTRIWELLFGSVCFYLGVLLKNRASRPVSEFLGVLGLGLIFFSVISFNQDTPVPGLIAFIPVLGAGLVLIFCHRTSLTGRFLCIRCVSFIGLISYSAYLWHQPILSFYRQFSGHLDLTYLEAFLCIALTFFLAIFSWSFIEKPFRKNMDLFNLRRFTFITIGFSVIFLSFATFSIFTDGGLYRFREYIRGSVGHEEFLSTLDDEFLDCRPLTVLDTANRWQGIARCKQSKNGYPDVVILGDSHAEHLFPGLASVLPEKNVVYYQRGGVPFHNNEKFSMIYDELLSNNENQIVLIAFDYALRFSNQSGVYRNDFVDSIGKLLSAGKEVVLVGDVPRFRVAPEMCKYRRINDVDPIPSILCMVNSLQAYEQRMVFDPLLSGISEELGVDYLDVFPAFCDDKGCSLSQDDQLLYRDPGHLSWAGSKVVGAYMKRRIMF
ncbi:MAG: hypothetical protein COA96_17180 [SAR86 cluster bacterium]|uniref:Acyltransferase n=1 Tax=SAR86 cluster bacterium TaxID=2030880 RepID=A0A2A5AFK0_9GAMM|nr:MAG: hypothetical protein COA96_17180 [SAR86 cluster bacterium]